MTRKEKITFLKGLMKGTLPVNPLSGKHEFEVHILGPGKQNLYNIDGKEVDKSNFEKHGGFEPIYSNKVQVFIGGRELSRE
jgi:hypothetical protein